MQNCISNIDDLRVGMEITTKRIFSLDDIENFRKLAQDFAPIHIDSKFSKKMGYDDVLVFGWLAAAPFSGLLGAGIPGPFTVLHSVKVSMSAPVYPNQEIVYRAKITHISLATGIVLLDLQAICESSNEIVIRGQAQCGFQSHNNGPAE